jgi:NADPH:quinone reductase-like Zn-dependent oxidoreductase
MGMYPIDKKAPTIGGFEGSGVVVAGNGEAESTFIGKRVAFLPSNDDYGSYGEYSISNIGYVIEIPEDISLDIAASSFVNPVTVLVMLETVKKANVKTVIHTAAAS